VWGGSILSSKALGLLPKALSQDLLLKLLDFHGLKAEPNCMYLYSAFEETIWPYDDRCRLMREDVLEPDASSVKIRKLDPSEVMTTAQAATALGPLIKPLPNFDEYVLGRSAAA
jgi:hypothetical protein